MPERVIEQLQVHITDGIGAEDAQDQQARPVALVFYEQTTGLIRRIVFDEQLTTTQLEAVHLPKPDEALIRIDKSVATFDHATAQRRVNEVTGLSQ